MVSEHRSQYKLLPSPPTAVGGLPCLKRGHVNDEYKLQPVSPTIFILLPAKASCPHLSTLLLQSRNAERRGQPRVDLTTPVAARPAPRGLGLLVFMGVWWVWDCISAVLVVVVWRW